MWWRFRKHRMAMVGMVLLGILGLCVLFPEPISPYAPGERNSKYVAGAPMMPHFFESDGTFHLLPFVYGVKSDRDPVTLKLLHARDETKIWEIEFFVRGGRLIANETAPRVHNSGHWTIEGAHCSQFENHLRAILGWPLGSTAATGHAAMVNLIGEMPAREAVLAVPGVHLHDYGKQPRPGRKLGHATVVARTAAGRDRLARRLLRLCAPGQRIALPDGT